MTNDNLLVGTLKMDGVNDAYWTEAAQIQEWSVVDGALSYSPIGEVIDMKVRGIDRQLNRRRCNFPTTSGTRPAGGSNPSAGHAAAALRVRRSGRLRTSSRRSVSTTGRSSVDSAAAEGVDAAPAAGDVEQFEAADG